MSTIVITPMTYDRMTNVLFVQTHDRSMVMQYSADHITREAVHAVLGIRAGNTPIMREFPYYTKVELGDLLFTIYLSDGDIKTVTRIIEEIKSANTIVANYGDIMKGYVK